jgi:hypothetical protein
LSRFFHFRLQVAQREIQRDAIAGNPFQHMLFRRLTQRAADQHRQLDFVMHRAQPSGSTNG